MFNCTFQIIGVFEIADNKTHVAVIVFSEEVKLEFALNQ